MVRYAHGIGKESKFQFRISELDFGDSLPTPRGYRTTARQDFKRPDKIIPQLDTTLQLDS